VNGWSCWPAGPKPFTDGHWGISGPGWAAEWTQGQTRFRFREGDLAERWRRHRHVRRGVRHRGQCQGGGRAPVLLDSTANFAALAERRHRGRNGSHLDSLVYLTGTYGISAGIITGGRLWRGERGTAGEVGHHHVERNRGRTQGCDTVFDFMIDLAPVEGRNVFSNFSLFW